MTEERQLLIPAEGLPPDAAQVEAVERLRPQTRRVLISSIRVEGRIRQDLGDIASLAESIRRSGLLHPVIVDEELRLLAGERRLRAALHAGLAEVEVRVFPGLSDLEKEIIELDENNRRKEFTANELARYYVQKKEYVEAALRALKAEEQRKLSETRRREKDRLTHEAEEQRREYEQRLEALALREEEIAAKMREFDARSEGQEDSHNIVETSVRVTDEQTAKAMGIHVNTLGQAERYVAAMTKYPLLDHKQWNQAAALEVAAGLDQIKAEAPEAHPRVIEMLSLVKGDDWTNRIRAAVKDWTTGSTEKRERLAFLLCHGTEDDRRQMESYLAGKDKIEPDWRRGRLHGILRDLESCCSKEDRFQPKFQALCRATRDLYEEIQRAEEASYGWIRQAADDRSKGA